MAVFSQISYNRFTNKDNSCCIRNRLDFQYANNEYLNHPLLSHFFTWNKQYDHPKLTCLPIGLNQDRQLTSYARLF